MGLEAFLADEPVSDRAVAPTVLVGKPHAHEGSVRELDSSRSLNLQEEGVDRVVYPGNRPFFHVAPLLNNAPLVVGNDPAAVELPAKALALEFRIELCEIDDEEIVGDPVDWIGILFAADPASVQERLVVSGHEARIRPLIAFAGDFHGPGREVFGKEGLCTFRGFELRLSAEFVPWCAREPGAGEIEGGERFAPGARRRRRELFKGFRFEGRSEGLLFRGRFYGRTGRDEPEGGEKEKRGGAPRVGKQCAGV